MRAKKSLGQHFLHSKSALDAIITAARINEGDRVMEIGPGTGILTQELLTAGAHVTAIEKDDRAIGLLEKKFEAKIKDGTLRLMHGDVLDMDPTGKADNFYPVSPYIIVANIPYYITGAILEKFLEYEPRPDRMILLVQREVARRITATDGKESLLSISVKAFGTPKLVANVPRGAFVPPPDVDSAIIQIEGISDQTFRQNKVDAKSFFAVVRAGFAHKRKFLKRNLEAVATRNVLDQTWTRLNFDQNIRAEDVSAQEWMEVAKNISVVRE